MTPLHRSVPVIVCTVLSFVALTAIGFFPLFGGPGYESALAAGLVLPSLVAIATAWTTAAERPAPSAAFARGLETACVMAGLAYLTTLIHGLRAGFCDVAGGTALFVLGPTAGALLAGAWGVLVGEMAGRVRQVWVRRALVIFFAVLAPIVGILMSFWRFYTSPIVFAYDPFFGFFSGALHDTIVTDTISSLLAYRAGTAATLFAFGSFATLFVRRGEKNLAVSPNRHPGVVWMGVAATAASIIVTAEGASLGHWQTVGTVRAALGGQIANDQCEIVYPRGLGDSSARRLLHDCATQFGQINAYFGLGHSQRVTAFVFLDIHQKRALMGAAGTSIAKPWRNEIYLHLKGYPHPVMGHELAHVAARNLGRGPFKVAGAYGGWLPNPGLIEGLAVSAAPEDDALTGQEWAAAMLRLGVLPPLSKVFALGFFGENMSKSYTVAGAFVSWLRETRGPQAVSDWYGGKSIEEAAGASLLDLERAWTEGLGRIEIKPAQLELARARFDRPSLFGRRCPHTVDGLNYEGRTLAQGGDCAGATALFDRARNLDPHHAHARVGLAQCAPRLAGSTAAEEQWRLLSNDETMPSTVRNLSLESLADLHLVAGRTDKAEAAYRELLDRVADEGRLRTLDVKIEASANPVAARAVAELLIGSIRRGPDSALAFSLLGKWMVELPGDGLPAYLIARRLIYNGLWEESAEVLDWAVQRRLPKGRVMMEALRLRIIVACALQDTETAKRTVSKWKSIPDLPANHVLVLERRLGACVAQPEPPAP